MKLVVCALSVLAALSAGCAGSPREEGDAGGRAESSPSAGPTSDSSAPGESTTGPCALLDGATIRRLSGEDLEGQESTVAGSQLSSCSYGRLDDLGVQVAQVPADEWARALPGMVDQLMSMGALGDPGLRKQLEEGRRLIEQGGTVPPDEACTLFSAMVRSQGVTPGTDSIITYIPGRDDPQAASAQACIDGTYTTIGVARPDLEAGPELEAALDDALATLHEG